MASEAAEGSRTFAAGGAAYDRFMGRYADRLAEPFADVAGVAAGTTVLDVGCGTGAFSAVAIRRTGVDAVRAVDPTPAFVAACRARHPGLEVSTAPAEALPFEDATFDRVAAQLVLHFVTEPDAAVAEMHRVTRPGGVVSACVWDFADGMTMLRAFWDAALSVDPQAPDEARVLRFGGPGEITGLFAAGGLTEVSEQLIEAAADYSGFDELWQSVAAGIGPAGSYLVGQRPERRQAIRAALFDRLGRPVGPFTLSGVARAARGLRPARDRGAAG